MSGSKLDQIVKGAPSPGVSASTVFDRSSPGALSLERKEGRSVNGHSGSAHASDPLASLPSSPPQIYLNLLILEASLRSQYLYLRARRRQHTFFLLVLTLWITYFSYALFLRPREDGRGVGGSVYWVVEVAEKVALMGGVVTGMLMWGTGQWDRGVRWPRRWVGVANRGLRNINAKIVIIKGSWWKELLGLLVFLFPYSSFFPSQPPPFMHSLDLPAENPRGHTTLRRHDEDRHEASGEEDLAPGGDFIKLLLLPKPFSADFRESWELYRIDYWEKENERRARARQQMKKRKALARKRAGWLWWWVRPGGRRGAAAHGERSHPKPTPDGTSISKPRSSISRSSSHSHTTSRSSTPANNNPPEADERPPPPLSARMRRGSSNNTTTTTSGSERKRKPKSSLSGDLVPLSRLTRLELPRSGGPSPADSSA